MVSYALNVEGWRSVVVAVMSALTAVHRRAVGDIGVSLAVNSR